MAEITVIVPIYRAEAYLSACIDSILGQTFADFQLILVDDGSPDGCAAICRDYAQREGRILFLQQENQGQSAARNLALRHAQGKYLCFVDSDDLIHPQTLEVLYGAVSRGAGIAMCRMLEDFALPGDFFAPRTPVFETFPMDEGTLVRLFDEGNYPAWVACAKLIPREIVESYPFTPGRVYEDNEAVCRWVTKAGTLAVTEEALYFYRTNPGSTTQSRFSLKKLDYLWALESIFGFYRKKGWKTLAARFQELYIFAAGDSYRAMAGEPGYEKAAEELRKNIRAYLRRSLPLTRPQFEELLDALHPKLIRFYWPLAGISRRLREGLFTKRTEKGE